MLQSNNAQRELARKLLCPLRFKKSPIKDNPCFAVYYNYLYLGGFYGKHTVVKPKALDYKNIWGIEILTKFSPYSPNDKELYSICTIWPNHELLTS
jgi:hypothetical protein